jgi:hypothetical protein
MLRQATLILDMSLAAPCPPMSLSLVPCPCLDRALHVEMLRLSFPSPFRLHLYEASFLDRCHAAQR